MAASDNSQTAVEVDVQQQWWYLQQSLWDNSEKLMDFGVASRIKGCIIKASLLVRRVAIEVTLVLKVASLVTDERGANGRN